MIQPSINLIAAFHAAFFGKDEAVMWDQLDKSPLDGLATVLDIIEKNPNLRSLETGFLLGITFNRAYTHSPLQVSSLVDAMENTRKIENGILKNNS